MPKNRKNLEMKIAFYNHELCHRGTAKAIYMYIKSIRSILPNVEIFYLFNSDSRYNNLSFGLYLLQCGTQIVPIKGFNDAIRLSKFYDLFYYVSSSDDQSTAWMKSLKCKSLLHQVGFQNPDFNSPTFFAYTSYWQSLYFTASAAPVLPYIIEKPSLSINQEEARKFFNIPAESIVLSRHGGLDTWNLPFVSQVVIDIVQKRPDIYFLFLGTNSFCHHPNILFLPSSSNAKLLEMFLSASDAMIHARWEGETFGLACAEFLARGKPIITWAQSRERNHFVLAGSSVLTYNYKFDLHALLLNLDKSLLAEKAKLINESKFNEFYSSSRVGDILMGYISKL